MIVINLFGGPGCGKSTMAAYIFSKLKMQHINCELVTEFAKDKTWEHNKRALACQPYVFGNQCYRIDKLKDQVDVIITDSPLFLAVFYNYDKSIEPEFTQMVLKKFNSFKNMNFFLIRNKKYNPIGRSQTEEEARALDNKIKSQLDSLHIEYGIINGDVKMADEVIIPLIKNELDNSKKRGRKKKGGLY